MSGEGDIQRGHCSAGQLGLLMCLLLAGCFDADHHPDTARYEYLYINGRFQGGHTAFPQGRDRANWKCFDGKLQREFDCTMVRGGWEQFQFIYRKRTP